jgi:hypothetical protein
MITVHEEFEKLKNELTSLLQSSSTFDIQAFWALLKDDERIALHAIEEFRHRLKEHL